MAIQDLKEDMPLVCETSYLMGGEPNLEIFKGKLFSKKYRDIYILYFGKQHRICAPLMKDDNLDAMGVGRWHLQKGKYAKEVVKDKSLVVKKFEEMVKKNQEDKSRPRVQIIGEKNITLLMPIISKK